MQKQAYDQLCMAQDGHWYHEGRRHLTEGYLRIITKELGHRLNILDAGCGTGSMLGLLNRYGQVTGLEISNYAASLCRKKYPEAVLKSGSVNDLQREFPKSSFDLIAFFNVLYHQGVDDDAMVLRQAHQIVKPGGYIMLIEPALDCLYRNNDRFCHGARRYSRKKISALLSQAGFCLKKCTYFNSVSFFPLLIWAQLERHGLIKVKEMSNELSVPPRHINDSFKFAMLLERIWIRIFGRIPLGTSVLAVGKRVD